MNRDMNNSSVVTMDSIKDLSMVIGKSLIRFSEYNAIPSDQKYCLVPDMSIKERKKCGLLVLLHHGKGINNGLPAHMERIRCT